MGVKKIVVVDIAGPSGLQNRVFDRALAGGNRHAWAICHLYEECRKAGIELITTDIFLENPRKFEGAILWRNATLGSRAEAVLAQGVRPAIFMGYEHPMYACRFYWNLERVTAPYDYALMPRGAASFVSPKTKFQAILAAQSYPQGMHVVSNFGNKKFLTMISGNVRVHPVRWLYVAVMNTVKPLPTFVNRELYNDRLDAVSHFSHAADFDLYGYGWDNPIRFAWGTRGTVWQRAVRKTWRGTVHDKFPVLQQYKFSICFENCIFSGWITEKIIDSLAAGCVPVYWGAPDITEFIPKECFIDFRDFKDYSELEQFLRGMDEDTYERYIAAINAFMASEKYRAFTQEKFAEDMIALFNSYYG